MVNSNSNGVSPAPMATHSLTDMVTVPYLSGIQGSPLKGPLPPTGYFQVWFLVIHLKLTFVVAFPRIPFFEKYKSPCFSLTLCPITLLVAATSSTLLSAHAQTYLLHSETTHLQLCPSPWCLTPLSMLYFHEHTLIMLACPSALPRAAGRGLGSCCSLLFLPYHQHCHPKEIAGLAHMSWDS